MLIARGGRPLVREIVSPLRSANWQLRSSLQLAPLLTSLIARKRNFKDAELFRQTVVAKRSSAFQLSSS